MFADDLLLFARADVVSATLLYQAFCKFSKTSGLEANLDKSSAYIGGVSWDIQQQILHSFDIPHGQLPVRYLGVPLSSKKLNYQQCKGLVEKITAKASSWYARKLCYTGRLQLIKTIMFGMQTSWCQIFILPKMLIKEVEAVCRSYLWTGNAETSKRALIAWSHLTTPKVAGGLNIKDICLWNKAAICKLLWAIANKKDRLWVRWIDIYFLKGKNHQALDTGKLSRMLRKVFHCQQMVDDCGGWIIVMYNGNYSIKLMYHQLQGNFNKVRWRRLICNNKSSPKVVFILWLAVQTD